MVAMRQLPWRALCRYLIQNDYSMAISPMLVTLTTILLVGMVAADLSLSLPITIMIGVLLGLWQTLGMGFHIREDYDDGTLDMIVTDGFGLVGYFLCRCALLFVCYSLPFAMIYSVFLMVMDASWRVIVTFVLSQIQMVFGILSLELVLLLTSELSSHYGALLLLMPFWMPTFLYTVTGYSDPDVWLIVLGITLLQIGLSLFTVSYIPAWRTR